MLARFRHLFGWLTVVFRSREDLILENLALRQSDACSKSDPELHSWRVEKLYNYLREGNHANEDNRFHTGAVHARIC